MPGMNVVMVKVTKLDRIAYIHIPHISFEISDLSQPVVISLTIVPKASQTNHPNAHLVFHCPLF